MGTGYYDRQGNELDRAGMIGAFESIEDRRVDRTQVDADVSVSTVHLVLDHSFGDGPPLIFETMIFGGEHDQYCWRYSTEEQARVGHAAVVAWVRGEGPEPDDESRVISAGPITIHPEQREARVHGDRLILTDDEFDLLAVLAGEPYREWDDSLLFGVLVGVKHGWLKWTTRKLAEKLTRVGIRHDLARTDGLYRLFKPEQGGE